LYKSLIIRVGERKFHVIFALGSESSWGRKFHGAKVPPMELSLPGVKVRGNESSIIRKQVVKSFARLIFLQKFFKKPLWTLTF